MLVFAAGTSTGFCLALTYRDAGVHYRARWARYNLAAKGGNMLKKVKVYDFETKEVITIPSAELAPGMVEAEVEGVGRVWVDAKQATMDGGYRHEPFSEDIRDRLREIKEALDEVHPMTLQEWEDGFRKDTHPEKEIAIWLRLAERYKAFTEEKEFSQGQRREVFNVMLACTMSPGKELVLETVTLSAITREEALDAIEAFCAALE